MAVKKKIPFKDILILGGVFLVYKMYELYRMGQELIVSVNNIKFYKMDIDPYGNIVNAKMKLAISLLNVTPTAFALRGLDIKISVGDVLLSKVTRKNFTIGRGETIVNFDVEIGGKQAMDMLAKVLKGDYPTFTVDTIAKIPFFTYKDSFKIPPSDYMTSDIKNILSYLK